MHSWRKFNLVPLKSICCSGRVAVHWKSWVKLASATRLTLSRTTLLTNLPALSRTCCACIHFMYSDCYHPFSLRISPSMQRIGFVRTLSPMFLKLGPQNFRRRLAVLVSRPWGSARELLAIVDKLDEKSQEILDTRKELLRGGDGALRSLEGKGRDLMTCICE